MVPEIVENIKALLGKKPMFGICIGTPDRWAGFPFDRNGLSNGARAFCAQGDPSAVQEIVENIKAFLGKKPMFGMCMMFRFERG